MSKLTKKQKAQQGKVDSNKLYPLADALSIVKECANAKFDESIDVAVQVGASTPRSPTRLCVAPWCCPTALARPPVWRCLRKVRKG
jgi:ribosomal protein L1